jgi:NADPH:quinone reductase-like Zn-dependent oxidoreductase
MKAMAQRSWAAGEPLTLVELPVPALGATDVQVRVMAIGVNPVDWKMRQGGPLRLAARILAPKPPVGLGVDFAGEVEALGPGVRRVKVGDRVVGGTDFSRGQRGSYADTVTVREDQVCVLPPGFDIEVAGALPVAGVTAWKCVVGIGRITAGKRVLILGASGGVGQFAVQIAKGVQSAFVVGVCSAKNVDRVRSLGADVVVDYGAGDALAQAKGYGPFDLVLTTNSGYPLDLNLYQAVKGMSAAAQIVRLGGSIICAAECSAGVPDHGEYARILASRDSPQALLEMITSPGYRHQDQWQVQIQARIQIQAKVYLKSGYLTPEQVRGAHLEPVDDLQEAVDVCIGRLGKGARVCVLPQGPQTIPCLATAAT